MNKWLVKRKLKYEVLMPWLMEVLYSLNPNREIDNSQTSYSCQPFFIIGSGRNGSTLLASLLNNHDELFIPPEQFALPYAIMEFKINGLKSWDSFVKKTVYEFKEKSANWSLSPEPIIAKLKNIDKKKRTFKIIIDTLYTEYADQHGFQFKYWGDKTPLNTELIEYIYPVYKTSKYIFLIRDGRDVVNSYLKFYKNKASNPDIAVWKWNKSIEQYEWLKKRLPEGNLIELRYENLVFSPELQLRKVQEFLDINIDHKLLTKRVDLKKMGVHKRKRHQEVVKPISPRSIGTWKDELPEVVAREVIPKMEQNLRRFNYITN